MLDDVELIASAGLKGGTSDCKGMEMVIGAALSSGKTINLLPPELIERSQRLVRSFSVGVISVFIMVGLLLSYFSLRIQVVRSEKQLCEARISSEKVNQDIEKKKQQMSINDILLEQPYWEEVLREVSNVIPENIYLAEIAMENDVLYFQGVILKEKAAEEVLAEFMLLLEDGIFNNVRLVSVQKLDEQQNDSEFEIKAEVSRK